MPTLATKPSTPRLSECARHVVIPKGIVTTAWPRVVAQCADMGVSFDLYQHGIGSVALGKRKDGKYAATVGGVVLSIPRQVCKTFLVGMIVIALCIIFPGLTVVWTAHRTRTATRTFQKLQGMVKRKKAWPHVAGIRTANGEQEIAFRNGSVIMFGAREQGFGRGFDEVDIVVFDEAQILTEKALEDIVPAANQSRQASAALVFFMGTPPRPSDPGEVFTDRRAKALSGKAHNMVYIECGADPDADSDDRAQWKKASPAFLLGRTHVESMERMRELLPDDDSFRREGLGIWDATSSPAVIDSKSWGLRADPASMAIERLTLGIDVSPDRSTAAVGLAGQRADGDWHVELDEHRTGVDWVPGWAVARCERNAVHAVVVDELSGLVEKRRGRNFLVGTTIEVTLSANEGRDMAIACSWFFDGIMSAWLWHTDQPQVNVALSVARKRPIGGAWGWNRKDAHSDITPVVAETLALWGAKSSTVKRPGRGGRSSQGRRATVLS